MKKIYKSRTDKKIFGLCGGIAAALEVDSTLVRCIWIVGTCFSGIFLGIIVYAIVAFCLPKSDVEVINDSVKKLYRSNTDVKIFGVCAGIAEYLDIDPFILRLLLAFSILFLGAGLLIYIIFALIMPKKTA